MRLALLSAAALLALVALGAVFWLRAPSRSTGADAPRATVETESASPAAELEAAADEGAARVSAEPAAEEASAAALAPSVPEESAAAGETAEVLVRAVADEDGAPLRGVELHSEPWPEPPGGRKRSPPVPTDALGLARFSLPPGSARIACRTQLDRALVLDLKPGEAREATMRLRRDADLDLHLRIVDAVTGEPIAGAGVQVQYVPGTAGLTFRSSSDEGGNVALRLPSWILLSCDVSKEGYSTEHVKLAGAHPTPELAKQVLLARGARIEGVVLRRDGAPAHEAKVTARARWLDLNARNPDTVGGGLGATIVSAFETLTSEQGLYALEVAPELDLWLEIAVDDRVVLLERMKLKPGVVSVVDLRLADSGTIAGRVLDFEGEPVQGQKVTLVQDWTTRPLRRVELRIADAESDADGRFAFASVPPGTWFVGPLDDVGKAEAVSLPPAGQTVEVVLHVGDGLYVRGRCVDPEGDPVGGMFVWTIAGHGSLSDKSASDGTFALGPLLPGGYGLRVGEKDGLVVSQPVPVEAGDQGVVLHLGRAASIRGKVMDAGGGEQPGKIQFVFKNEAIPELSFYDVGEGGRFEIGRLGAGTYWLFARTNSGMVSEQRTVTLDYGDELVLDLLVSPGGQARLLLPDGAYASVFSGGEVMDFGLKGDATTRYLSPGPIEIKVWKDGALLERRDATITAGEVLELDLR